MGRADTTRRAEFPISGRPLPRAFIRAVALVKAAAARANTGLGLLDAEFARVIVEAADEVAAGQHDAQFPIDVFQTGSGTSTNMKPTRCSRTWQASASGARCMPTMP